MEGGSLLLKIYSTGRDTAPSPILATFGFSETRGGVHERANREGTGAIGEVPPLGFRASLRKITPAGRVRLAPPQTPPPAQSDTKTHQGQGSGNSDRWRQ